MVLFDLSDGANDAVVRLDVDFQSRERSVVVGFGGLEFRNGFVPPGGVASADEDVIGFLGLRENLGDIEAYTLVCA